MSTVAGVDLNGLADVAAFDSVANAVTGGAIPSVVVLPKILPNDRLTLIAGEEATRAVEGRGWDWPDSARINENKLSLRIPIIAAFDCLTSDRRVPTPHGLISAADIVAAAVDSLATSRGHDIEQRIVLSIPDNGLFNDEVQQKLLDSFAARGAHVTLLWRPIAAILGMADQLNPLVDKLVGKDVAVISCLNNGLDVCRLTIHKKETPDGAYLVPERNGSSNSIPYVRPLVDFGAELAETVMAPFGVPGWQGIWGSDLVLRWLLGLSAKPVVVQTPSGWKRISGVAPSGLVSVHVSDENIDKIDELLETVEYVIYEGPALEAPADDSKLVYYLSNRLRDGRFRKKFERSRTSLTFQGFGSHLAAKGCIEYQRRRDSSQVTYFDHLPQIRLAVRDRDKPIFIPLIPPQNRVEGGEAYEDSLDLGLSISSGADQLTFYVIREGNVAPRLSTVELPKRMTIDVPVKMTIRQQPTQGRARLTIEPTNDHKEFGAIDVNWDRMEVLSGTTEAMILELLSEKLQVPSVQFLLSHTFIWNYNKGGNGTLADLVVKLDADSQIWDPVTLLPAIKNVRALVSIAASPYLLSRVPGSEREPCRAVSSDGEIPGSDEGLSENVRSAFDNVLRAFGNWIEKRPLDVDLRKELVLAGSWTFLRCPIEIKDYLRVAAERRHLVKPDIDFNAMGRCFCSENEIKAYFYVLEKIVDDNDGVMKLYHVNSLFNILSLRDLAPKYLSEGQARSFAGSVLRTLDSQRRARNFSNIARVCLKALAGLIRFRQIDPQFLSVDSDRLGQRAAVVINDVIAATTRAKYIKINELAKATLAWLEMRGTDDNILRWDDD